jgi:hypothetical protein
MQGIVEARFSNLITSLAHLISMIKPTDLSTLIPDNNAENRLLAAESDMLFSHSCKILRSYRQPLKNSCGLQFELQTNA